MSIAIKVEGLSKRFLLGNTFEHTISSRLGDLFSGRGALRPSQPREEFWALRDVNLEIAEGETVGIIGGNGAGKSTLLKILSRITPPTNGRALVRGRLSSLLEVGTGFHPELTGRENIFLNAAILGMRKIEVQHRFNEIVEFAGVEKFIDTPVKRYSSGMKVRLAFAVAAHLEPDILIIDEVLAVGDAEFQKRCLGKMSDVAREGRTVLFVSHNMAAVQQLCSRAIQMRAGKVVLDGPVLECVSEYLAGSSAADAAVAFERSDSRFWLRQISLKTSDGRLATDFGFDQPVTIEIHYELLESCRGVTLGIRILTAGGMAVFSYDLPLGERNHMPVGNVCASVEIPAGILVPGRFLVTFHAYIPGGDLLCLQENALSFQITESGSPLARYAGNYIGCVVINCSWREEKRSIATLA